MPEVTDFLMPEDGGSLHGQNITQHGLTLSSLVVVVVDENNNHLML